MAYIDDHPTSFTYRPDVAEVVRRIQAKFPWKLFINTYFWHPPYSPPAITRRYDLQSFDVWGGGGTNASNYTGYRGKPLPDALHKAVFDFVFNMRGLPNIHWVCTNGWMWTSYGQWERYDPYDPWGADMGHWQHLHFTYH